MRVGWRAIEGELRDTRRMFRVRAGRAQTLEGMYVRVGGSAVDEGLETAEGFGAEPADAGRALPWGDSLAGLDAHGMKDSTARDSAAKDGTAKDSAGT